MKPRIKKICVIIGTNHGDEGKGNFVDYAVSHMKLDGYNPMMVRYGGGNQTTKEVVTDSFDHEFSNFGSCSKLNTPTFFMRRCTVNPSSFLSEKNDLGLQNCEHVAFNGSCGVVTPLDMLYSQLKFHVDGTHSSGLGIHETIERCKDPRLSTTFKDSSEPMSNVFITSDLFNIDRCKKLIDENRLRESPNGSILHLVGVYDMLCEVNGMKDFYSDFYNMKKTTTCIKGKKNMLDFLVKYNIDSLVFEGHLGLGLRYNPDDPTTSSSETGLPYVVPGILWILNCLGQTEKVEIQVYYITRTYATRRGNGFLPWEIPYGTHDFQEPCYRPYINGLSYGCLDGVRMKNRIDKDLNISNISKDVDLKKNLDQYCDKLESYLVVNHMEETDGGMLDITGYSRDPFEFVRKYGLPTISHFGKGPRVKDISLA